MAAWGFHCAMPRQVVAQQREQQHLAFPAGPGIPNPTSASSTPGSLAKRLNSLAHAQAALAGVRFIRQRPRHRHHALPGRINAQPVFMAPDIADLPANAATDRHPTPTQTDGGEADTWSNDHKFRYDELFCKFIYISKLTSTLVEISWPHFPETPPWHSALHACCRR